MRRTPVLVLGMLAASAICIIGSCQYERHMMYKRVYSIDHAKLLEECRVMIEDFRLRHPHSVMGDSPTVETIDKALYSTQLRTLRPSYVEVCRDYVQIRVGGFNRLYVFAFREKAHMFGYKTLEEGLRISTNPYADERQSQ